jgi:hypothetical protein
LLGIYICVKQCNSFVCVSMIVTELFVQSLLLFCYVTLGMYWMNEDGDDVDNATIDCNCGINGVKTI